MLSTTPIRPDVLSYLETLRRLPDDIVLGLAGSDFDESDGARCIVGWAVRGAIAKRLGLPVEQVGQSAWIYETPRGFATRDWSQEAAHLFGGTEAEWDRIYMGVVTDRMPLIEEALAERLDEILLNV
jgi:hypothetical protein